MTCPEFLKLWLDAGSLSRAPEARVSEDAAMGFWQLGQAMGRLGPPPLTKAGPLAFAELGNKRWV
jgi:hypothetical protein